LEVVGVPPETIYTRVRAKREDRTSYCSSSERRIDITLDFGDFGIGIENKPFAFEAENQLTDYSLHLRGKYKRFLLVYLSGDGREPTSLSKSDLAALQAAKELIILDYQTDFYRWLQRCRHDCKAEKVRWFLEDFVEYVKKTFAWEEGMTKEATLIADTCVESEQNLRIAAKLFANANPIKAKIIQEFIQSVIDKVKQRLGQSWTVEDVIETPLERGSCIAAYKTTWKDGTCILLHCGKTGPRDLNFSVFLGNKLSVRGHQIANALENTTLTTELKQALDRYAVGRRLCDETPWWKFVDEPYRDWNTEEALIFLWKKDEEAVEYYTQHLFKICEVAGPLLDGICDLR
jgi:hypothetical protein